MAFGPVPKYPGEKPDTGIDWSAKLTGGRTLVSSAWTATSGLTILADSMTTTTTAVRVSGGVAGTTYVLKNSVVFSDGQERYDFISVEVEADLVP